MSKAKVKCDSIAESGSRLTTIELECSCAVLNALASHETLSILSGYNATDNRVTAIITATEWDTFFRACSNLPHQKRLQHVAGIIQKAVNASTPSQLDHTLWHLPYITHKEYTGLGTTFLDLALLSVARCVNVISKASECRGKELVRIDAYAHQAKPMNTLNSPSLSDRGVTHRDNQGSYYSANFKGWVQHKELQL